MRLAMRKRQIIDRVSRPGFVFGVLFLAGGLAYGLLIPWLHLYIDDWIWVWTWEKLGRAGLVKYFSANRPLWGLIFQVTLPLLGQNILAFHLFSFIIRLGSALACWWLLRLVWPKRPEIALVSALLFLVYPGFILQPIALTYGHLFLIYLFFLLSLCFNLLALRRPRLYLPATAAALLFSTFNLLTMEYFFTLELARPVLLWLLAAEQEEPSLAKRAQWVIRLWRVFRQWLPYLLLYLGVIAWRVFVFKVITARYPLSLLNQARQNPAGALLELGKSLLTSLWNVTMGAWLPAFSRLAHLNWRLNNSILTLAVIGLSAGILFAALLLFFKATPQNSPARKSSLSIILLGLVLLLLAGWPFWLTGLKILPVSDKSRFTIPFILGSALLFCGLLDLLRPAWLRAGLLALLVGAACGYHFQIANTYRLETEQNRQLMWQIAWRIPNMQAGTALLITDFPVTTYDTPTMATELNMIYPIAGRFPDLAYDILYDRELDEFKLAGGLVKDTPIKDHNVTSVFSGSTSQVLSAQYNLSQCFRLLDPSLDGQDASLAAYTRRAAQLSDWKWVQTGGEPSLPPAHWFGKEPARQWCYYFEKAELARQVGDWAAAARLGDEAQAQGFAPRDDMEKLVFIEAYAHTGRWERALEISQSFRKADKQPVLCALWQRIAQNTPAGLENLNKSGACRQAPN